MIAATGRGLKEGKKGQQNIFKLFIENPDMENDRVCQNLDVRFDGPGESKVWKVAHGNGTVTVTYYLTHAGKFKIYISFAGESIPGSPFNLTVK